MRIEFTKQVTLGGKKLTVGTKYEMTMPSTATTNNHLFTKVGKTGKTLKFDPKNVIGISQRQLEELTVNDAITTL